MRLSERISRLEAMVPSVTATPGVSFDLIERRMGLLRNGPNRQDRRIDIGLTHIQVRHCSDDSADLSHAHTSGQQLREKRLRREARSCGIGKRYVRRGLLRDHFDPADAIQAVCETARVRMVLGETLDMGTPCCLP